MGGSRASLLAAFEGVREVEDGILASQAGDASQASNMWSGLARANPISAAAASPSADPFVKSPTWITEYINPRHELALDAGCGYGQVSLPLLEKCGHLALAGVDISDVMLREYLRLARDHQVEDRLVLYCGGLGHLPLREDSFDCAISAAVLLHLPRDETRRVLGELYRVLRPGGRIILASCFPNLANLEGMQSWLYEHLLRDSSRNGPLRAYTRRQVMRLFEGWREVQIIEHGATVLPRQVFGVVLPAGSAIRELNQRADGRLPEWMMRKGLLLSQHDVVTSK